MRNYFKNKMKDRLSYCHDWKNSVDIYLANKKITKQPSRTKVTKVLPDASVINSTLYVILEVNSAEEIELRVDANGAFAPEEALDKLQRLSELDLHSIEQPIKQGQYQEMTKLCKETPLPIALDEELIGVFSVTKKEELLQTIQPQYIILKPSLIGGFKGTQEWIDLAEKQNIGWWITSALESNIGLNAISQFTFMQNSNMPQGLGTGSLYTNNIESPLMVKGEYITYAPKKTWDVNSIL